MTIGLRADFWDHAVRGEWWEPEGMPSIPASWIADLLVTGEIADGRKLHHKGIRIRGVVIEDQLDLEDADVAHPLILDLSRLEAGVNAMRARMTALCLTGSEVASLRARWLTVRTNVDLTGSYLSEGADVQSARVGGSLIMQSSGTALFRSDNEIRLAGVMIGGDLNFDGALLRSRTGRTLVADQARVGRHVLLGQSAGHHFRSDGTIRLLGSEIGGLFSCPGARLDCDGGDTLYLDQATIGSHLLLNALASRPFESHGRIRMRGTQVGGLVSFGGARLSNPDGETVAADRLVVEGHVLLTDWSDHPFESIGEIRLPHAVIGGNLNCDGARMSNPEGVAFDARSAHIQGTATFRSKGSSPFEMEGDLQLSGIEVSGHLVVKAGSQLDGLDLSGASVHVLEDDPATAPEPGGLRLDGFRYQRFAEGTTQEPHSRVDWVSRQPSYNTQPYQQLMAVYRASGRDSWARAVGVEMESRRTAEIGRNVDVRFVPPNVAGRILRFIHRSLGYLVAYGYRPWLALVWLIGFGIVAAGMFTWAMESGVMAPTQAPVGVDVEATICTPAYPCMDGRLYAVDVMVPILDVNQEDYWLPDASAAGSVPWGVAVGGATVRWLQLAFSALGWLLGAVFVATIAGWVRRD